MQTDYLFVEQGRDVVASDVLAQGMKWAILENRSTTTRMESCRLGVLGNPRIKSILTSDTFPGFPD
jgi:hypothetical protein